MFSTLLQSRKHLVPLVKICTQLVLVCCITMASTSIFGHVQVIDRILTDITQQIIFIVNAQTSLHDSYSTFIVIKFCISNLASKCKIY